MATARKRYGEHRRYDNAGDPEISPNVKPGGKNTV